MKLCRIKTLCEKWGCTQQRKLFWSVFYVNFNLYCVTNDSLQLSVLLIFLGLTQQESTSAADSYLWLCCLRGTLFLSDKVRVQPFLCSRLVSHSEELYLQHQTTKRIDKQCLQPSFRKAFWRERNRIRNRIGSLMFFQFSCFIFPKVNLPQLFIL